MHLTERLIGVKTPGGHWRFSFADIARIKGNKISMMTEIDLQRILPYQGSALPLSYGSKKPKNGLTKRLRVSRRACLVNRKLTEPSEPSKNTQNFLRRIEGVCFPSVHVFSGGAK